MKFIHFEVDTSPGDAVLVKLSGTAANVRLMDAINFSSYRRGGRHRYIGGHFTQSPAVLQPPHAGHWYVVVDLGGFAGNIRAAVSVVPA